MEPYIGVMISELSNYSKIHYSFWLFESWGNLTTIDIHWSYVDQSASTLCWPPLTVYNVDFWNKMVWLGLAILDFWVTRVYLSLILKNFIRLLSEEVELFE